MPNPTRFPTPRAPAPVVDRTAEQVHQAHISGWEASLQSFERIRFPIEMQLAVAVKSQDKWLCQCCGKPLVWQKTPRRKMWSLWCPKEFHFQLLRNWVMLVRPPQFKALPTTIEGMLEAIKESNATRNHA